MRVAANRRYGRPKTPAERTKILKGIGGGSMEGMARARMSHFLKWARVWSTRSRPNFRTRNASPPRRPMYQSAEHPASEPRVAARTYIHAVAGCPADDVTTSTSLISGTLRNDESKNATTNRPKGPSVGMRTVWIQTTMSCIGDQGSGSAEEFFRVGVEVEELAVAAPVNGGGELALGFGRGEVVAQHLDEALLGGPSVFALVHRLADGGEEGQLAEPLAQPLLPLRLLGR